MSLGFEGRRPSDLRSSSEVDFLATHAQNPDFYFGSMDDDILDDPGSYADPEEEVNKIHGELFKCADSSCLACNPNGGKVPAVFVPFVTDMEIRYTLPADVRAGLVNPNDPEVFPRFSRIGQTASYDAIDSIITRETGKKNNDDF